MNYGAFAAIVKEDKVLLVRSLTNKRFMDSWSLPGGVVEKNETLQEAAEREALEETGIICQVGKLLSEVDNVESDIKVSIFKADYISGVISKDDREIAEAEWFKISDAFHLTLAYNTEAILQDLYAHLSKKNKYE